MHKSHDKRRNTRRNKTTQKQQIGPQSIPTKLVKTFNKTPSKPLTS